MSTNRINFDTLLTQDRLEIQKRNEAIEQQKKEDAALFKWTGINRDNFKEGNEYLPDNITGFGQALFAPVTMTANLGGGLLGGILNLAFGILSPVFGILSPVLGTVGNIFNSLGGNTGTLTNSNTTTNGNTTTSTTDSNTDKTSGKKDSATTTESQETPTKTEGNNAALRQVGTFVNTSDWTKTQEIATNGAEKVSVAVGVAVEEYNEAQAEIEKLEAEKKALEAQKASASTEKNLKKGDVVAALKTDFDNWKNPIMQRIYKDLAAQEEILKTLDPNDPQYKQVQAAIDFLKEQLSAINKSVGGRNFDQNISEKDKIDLQITLNTAKQNFLKQLAENAKKNAETWSSTLPATYGTVAEAEKVAQLNAKADEIEAKTKDITFGTAATPAAAPATNGNPPTNGNQTQPAAPATNGNPPTNGNQTQPATPATNGNPPTNGNQTQPAAQNTNANDSKANAWIQANLATLKEIHPKNNPFAALDEKTALQVIEQAMNGGVEISPANIRNAAIKLNDIISKSENANIKGYFAYNYSSNEIEFRGKEKIDQLSELVLIGDDPFNNTCHLYNTQKTKAHIRKIAQAYISCSDEDAIKNAPASTDNNAQLTDTAEKGNTLSVEEKANNWLEKNLYKLQKHDIDASGSPFNDPELDDETALYIIKTCTNTVNNRGYLNISTTNMRYAAIKINEIISKYDTTKNGYTKYLCVDYNWADSIEYIPAATIENTDKVGYVQDELWYYSANAYSAGSDKKVIADAAAEVLAQISKK